jgi:arylsulfatase
MGGVGRGQPTPNLDRMAAEGMTFYSFYGQPSCTPGRAAIMTSRIPNRSGMTTVSFQGQGSGLPHAEWTIASVLKTAWSRTGAMLRRFSLAVAPRFLWECPRAEP